MSNMNMRVDSRSDFQTMVFIYNEMNTQQESVKIASACYRAMETYVTGLGACDQASLTEFKSLAKPIYLVRPTNGQLGGMEALAKGDLVALSPREELGKTPPPPDFPSINPQTPVACVLSQPLSGSNGLAFGAPAASCVRPQARRPQAVHGTACESTPEKRDPLKNYVPGSFQEFSRIIESYGPQKRSQGGNENRPVHQGMPVSVVASRDQCLEGAYWLTPYVKWCMRSFDNTLVSILRILQTDDMNLFFLENIKGLIGILVCYLEECQGNESFSYHSIAPRALELFKKIKGVSDLDELDLLKVEVCELLRSSEMEQIKYRQIQNAMIPIMSYLDGKELPLGGKIKAYIEQALNVFRRWGWIDADGQLHQQADTSELLEKISQWLIEMRLLAPQGQFVSTAYLEEDRSVWEVATVLDTDERDLIRAAYADKKEPVPKDLNNADRRSLYIQSILRESTREDRLQGLLTTSRERIASAYRPEPVNFYGLCCVVAQQGELVPDNRLDQAILRHTFHGADRLPAFEVQEDGSTLKVVKYQIPLRPFIGNYEGEAPPTIFLTRTAQVVPRESLQSLVSSPQESSAVESSVSSLQESSSAQSEGASAQEVSFAVSSSPSASGSPSKSVPQELVAILPEIVVAPEISFHGKRYVLSRMLFKTGTQHAGHYISLFSKGNKTLVVDSLEAELYELDHPLHESALRYAGAHSFCYRLEGAEDVSPKNNLVQAVDSNSCYVLQAIAFMWRNNLFASINGMNSSVVEGQLEQEDALWNNQVVAHLLSEFRRRGSKPSSAPLNPHLRRFHEEQARGSRASGEQMPQAYRAAVSRDAFESMFNALSVPAAVGTILGSEVTVSSPSQRPRSTSPLFAPVLMEPEAVADSLIRDRDFSNGQKVAIRPEPLGTLERARTSPILRDVTSADDDLYYFQYKNALEVFSKQSGQLAKAHVEGLLKQLFKTPYQIWLMKDLIRRLEPQKGHLHRLLEGSLNSLLSDYEETFPSGEIPPLYIVALDARYEADAEQWYTAYDIQFPEASLRKIKKAYEGWKKLKDSQSAISVQALEA